MKVVSRPVRKKWKRKLTCENCGAVLEVTASDLTRPGIHEMRFKDPSAGRCWFNCPVCEMPSHVAEDLVPSHVVNSLAPSRSLLVESPNSVCNRGRYGRMD